MINHRNALWNHAELLAARCELAAIHSAMRKVEGAAMDPRTPWRRARDYYGARDLLGQRIDELRADIERAEVAWQQ